MGNKSGAGMYFGCMYGEKRIECGCESSRQAQLCRWKERNPANAQSREEHQPTRNDIEWGGARCAILLFPQKIW